MSTKDDYLKRLEAEQQAAIRIENEQRELSQPQVESKAGAPVAPEQVPPKEDASEIERLRAEIEALKQAQQSGGNAAVEEDQVEALPEDRLNRYRDALGDDVAEMFAEDLLATRREAKAKTKELESKLKQSERYKDYVGKVEKDVLDTYHSAEFQAFAKSQKLGRKLTLADELEEINTTNDVDGAAYLSEQVKAWQATQKATRKASGSASEPVQRYSQTTQVVTEQTLEKILSEVRRTKSGTPQHDAALKKYDAALAQMKETQS